MDLSDLVSPTAVFAGTPLNTKKAALQFLSNQAAPLWGLEPDMVLQALDTREKLGTTGFGGGIAIPHGRVAGLDRMVAAVLRPAQPVDWEALDGQPVGLMVMLLGPAEGSGTHLKALARISRALRDRALVAKLCGARDAEAMWTLLCSRQVARTAA